MPVAICNCAHCSGAVGSTHHRKALIEAVKRSTGGGLSPRTRHAVGDAADADARSVPVRREVLRGEAHGQHVAILVAENEPVHAGGLRVDEVVPLEVAE